MNTFDKNMEQIFDVTPQVTEKKKENLPSVPAGEPNLKVDLENSYAQSKDNLEEFIEHGKEAMEELYQIAKAGQHPRAFEVFATLLKNVGELNDKLIDTQKKVREVEGKNREGGDTKINNAVFVGSTDELNKLLKGKSNG